MQLFEYLQFTYIFHSISGNPVSLPSVMNLDYTRIRMDVYIKIVKIYIYIFFDRSIIWKFVDNE